MSEKHSWVHCYSPDGFCTDAECAKCHTMLRECPGGPGSSPVKEYIKEQKALEAQVSSLKQQLAQMNQKQRMYLATEVLMGDHSPEYVRERRAELLALLGIPEELWKEM